MWKRNPLECIQDLLRNTAFRDHTEYVPRRVYRDVERNSRMYGEMWTADWWWNMQVRRTSNTIDCRC